MDVVGEAVKAVEEIFIDIVVDGFAFLQAEVTADVFGLDVESGCKGFLELVADAHGGAAEWEGHECVNDVGFFDDGAKGRLVWFCEDDAVFFDVIVKNFEIYFFDGVKILIVGSAGGYDEYFVSAFFQVRNESFYGNGSSVIFFAENIGNDGNLHSEFSKINFAVPDCRRHFSLKFLVLRQRWERIR